MKKLILILLIPLGLFGQGKISEMPAASTVTGTELMEIVQGGVNKKITLSQTGNTFYVPLARTLTINGTAYDLNANRSWSVGNVFTSGTYSNPSWITSFAATKITGTLLETQGGTGFNSYTVGDLLYASAPTTLQKLGIGANGYALISNGTTPSWQPISTTLAGLSDVSLTGLASGDFLKYNGSAWINRTSAQVLNDIGAWSLADGGTLTGANTITGSASNTLTFKYDNLATTQINGAGLWLHNTTVATIGVPVQYSPSLVFSSDSYKNVATTGTQKHSFAIYSSPISTNTPYGELNLAASTNSGSFGTFVTFRDPNIREEQIQLSHPSRTFKFWMGIGNGAVISTNQPYWMWGTSFTSTNGNVQFSPNNAIWSNITQFFLRNTVNSSSQIIGAGAGTTATTGLGITWSAYNSGSKLIATTGNWVLLDLADPNSSNAEFSPSSGNASITVVKNRQRINTTGSYVGVGIGFDHNPELVSTTGYTNIAFRAASGGILFAGGLTTADVSATLTANTKLDVRGIGTTTANILRLANSSNTERLSVLDNGQINISGSAGTSGQVLTSAGTGAPPTWSTPSSGITNSAANNELMKSDGTNAVSSGILSSTAGNIILGLTTTSGSTRTITSDGSSSDVGITIQPKGSGSQLHLVSASGASEIYIQNSLNYFNTTGSAYNAFESAQYNYVGYTGSSTSIVYPLRVSNTTSGTPANNSTGTGISFYTRTSISGINDELGSTIESLMTDKTSTAEKFDLIFKIMDSGSAAAERLRIKSTGRVVTTAPVTLKGYTVATLPAGNVGDTAYVTDALAPTYLATIVGGGAIVTPVFYDGTNWVSY